MHMHKRNTRRQGFTIVELLIVVVVIAILATISVVAYTGIQDRARNAIVVQNLSNTAKALEMFNAENGRYPVAADAARVKSVLKLTETKTNTLLYCFDSSNPTAWTLVAARYPSKTSIWNSSGLHNDDSSQVVGSGQPTCQAATGNSSSSMGGLWAFSIATIE